MRCFGLRDFKLKLGLGEEPDTENLRVTRSVLAKAIRGGRCTLRVDVNGAWETGSVPQRVAELKSCGVCAVEQPVFCDAEKFVELSRRCALPLIADESLLTESDAGALLIEPGKIWWNIRISKNGGFRRAVDLAVMAASGNVPFVIGCMVGESGILSAAQRRLLQICPPARFVEGNYGKYLLKGDLTRPSLRFGYGGTLGLLKGDRLGMRVIPVRLRKYAKLLVSLENAPIR
jgi:muconate cycloisomerase